MSTSSEGASVWVVIAAFNESKVIRSVVDGLKSYSVVVVDDGSSDATAEALAGSGVTVLRHSINLGQGAALQTGIKFALTRGATIIVTFDADGQHVPEDIETLTRPIKDGAAEVALGTRFGRGARVSSIPLGKRLLLAAATCFTRMMTGLDLTDTHNGLRAFSRASAARLDITQNRMAHASQILSQIASWKVPCVEVPVQVLYTAYSIEKGQRVSNSINILWETFSEIFKR